MDARDRKRDHRDGQGATSRPRPRSRLDTTRKLWWAASVYTQSFPHSLENSKRTKTSAPVLRVLISLRCKRGTWRAMEASTVQRLRGVVQLVIPVAVGVDTLHSFYRVHQLALDRMRVSLVASASRGFWRPSVAPSNARARIDRSCGTALSSRSPVLLDHVCACLCTCACRPRVGLAGSANPRLQVRARREHRGLPVKAGRLRAQ